MNHKLLNLVFYIVALLTFSSCAKELSIENIIVHGTSSGTASYTFSGLLGKCTVPNINGSYIKNTITTDSNTVALQVTVVVPGTYTIATGINNGISFTATGTFTTIGDTTIVLAATGTPLNQGVFNYMAGLNGCVFPINFTASAVAQYAFPTAPNTCAPDSIIGHYLKGVKLSAANYIVFTVNVTSPGIYNLSTNIINGISFAAVGNFSTVGIQSIVLFGTGTPTETGDFNYAPELNNGCSFTVMVGAGLIICNIDGDYTIFNHLVRSKQGTALTLDLAGSVSSNLNENIILSLAKQNSPIMTGDIFNPVNIAAGNTYLINYTDSSGVYWGSANTSTSNPLTISILKKTANLVSGTFSGDISQIAVTGGKIKTITEGAFSIIIQ